MINRYEQTPITVSYQQNFKYSYDAIDLSIYFIKIGFPSL